MPTCCRLADVSRVRERGPGPFARTTDEMSPDFADFGDVLRARRTERPDLATLRDLLAARFRVGAFLAVGAVFLAAAAFFAGPWPPSSSRRALWLLPTG